jgi:hypothetical protein
VACDLGEQLRTDQMANDRPWRGIVERMERKRSCGTQAVGVILAAS